MIQNETRLNVADNTGCKGYFQRMAEALAILQNLYILDDRISAVNIFSL